MEFNCILPQRLSSEKFQPIIVYVATVNAGGNAARHA
jgi:hypothetical protein